MALTNFGEAFPKNCLRKFYFKALAPAICNTDYEGEVKALGDQVTILMFLNDIALTTYAANTNMTTEYPVDTESHLQIDRAKYWNFNIDRVDRLFTYVDDEDSTLIENAGDVLTRAIDTDMMKKISEECQAGHIVPNGPSEAGTFNLVIGSANTYVTITTAASWGVATLTGVFQDEPRIAGEANGWPTNIVGRGFRTCSSKINSPWYRITARTNSSVITFNNWDGSTTGDGISGCYIKGMWLGAGLTVGGTCGVSYGCQIEGYRDTAITATNIYALVCEAAQKLDEEGIPTEDRHLIIPAWFKARLIQATQLQPDIAMYYTDTVINGKVGRVSGFDLHLTSDDRFSTCVAPIIDMGSTGDWSAVTGTGYLIPAVHKSFITFAHKWAESRVVDAELQFAKLYQGLNLWGFKVLPLRRKAGAVIYGHPA